ncbi:PA2169 family four-helix-bundle protein [Noviherbaspirillum cavernae]|uniref:PA2169 family four-helix-bundle protein n=1 Tax=Noviherbaspirillum cavernae TaxID=2320862 RepID=A0A418WX09_9BURK|nr:PA2169 family four-helix-bundle protein [Noviherbaspirillum cavernae]RJG04742.1 PA2169 family four-helix-bundle protein [Noviherbaspirillum cavernae]
MDNDEIAAVLNDLIETCKDGEAGFRTCADDVNAQQLKIFLQNRAQSCASAAEDLQQLVRTFGRVPETRGGLGGVLHRRWIDVKSLLTSHDAAPVLEECERGEDVAEQNYRNALEKKLPPDVRAIVERQYQGVLRNREQVRKLHEQYRTA